MKLKPSTLSLCLLLLTAPVAAAGTGPARLTDDLVRLLEERYVFPEKVDTLRHLLDEGQAAGLTVDDPAAAADRLTELLFAATGDRHLRVRARRDGGPETSTAERLEQARRGNFGFGRIEALDGNVGYLEMRAFVPTVAARRTAEAALDFLAGTDAMIIDLRNSEGGDPSMVQLLCSAFLDAGIHLNTFRWREGNRVDEIRTLEDGPATRRVDVPLFILIGARTFSAAEELAYDLQALGRARLVGTTTRGGANPGREVRLSDELTVFVPTGTALNPVTGTNWEGTGVQPDVATPEAEALDRALVEATRAADAFRATRRSAETFDMAALMREQAEVEKLFASGDREQAVTRLEAALSRALDAGLMRVSDLGGIGRQLADAGRTDMAVAILHYRTGREPASAEAWVDLAYAVEKAGDPAAAEQHRLRARELN